MQIAHCEKIRQLSFVEKNETATKDQSKKSPLLNTCNVKVTKEYAIFFLGVCRRKPAIFLKTKQSN